MTYTIPDYARPFVPDAQTDWKLFDAIRYAVLGTSTGEDKDLCPMFLDWWRIINVECFESRLQPLFISREVSSYGHWIGLCCSKPNRQIKLAWAAFSCVHHEEAVTIRLPGLENLNGNQHNAAMVILHEMMHQSLFEAQQDYSHESEGWALLCKYLGDVLGLPYDYIPLVKAKVPVLDDDGQPIKRPVFKDGEPVLLKNGQQKMEQVRKNVRVPSKLCQRDESKPLAPYSAFYCFPYCENDPWIQANTTVKTSGKAVDKNDGKPVIIPPQF